MNTSPVTFSRAERIALQQMIDSPDLVEYHGDDKAWQAALSGALHKPSLRDSLNLVPPSLQDSDGPAMR